MSIELPGFLTEALGLIGMNWPEGDEDALFAAGGVWSDYAGRLRDVESSSTTAAGKIWDVNSGPAVDAFKAWWADGPQQHLTDDASGADIVSGLLEAYATATIALKTVYLVQLGILAATIIEATATAFITFGASLAEIPIVTGVVRIAIKAALDQMIQEILF